MISKGIKRFKSSMFVVAVVVAAVSILATAAWSDDRIAFPRPKSHRADWVNNHGVAAQVQQNSAGLAGSTCLVCHSKNDCKDCHTTRPPRDHTNFWRTSGHGLTASINRERCLICHRQDYCVRCHNETAPRSHIGSWVNRHCQWCHFASGISPADNCGVCHKVAPHNSRPGGHPAIGPQTNCSLCHP